MALFGFRVRSADRDSAGDSARMQRLADAMSALIAEIESERSGFQARRQQASETAAFSMAALEDDGADYLSGKVDDLTNTMTRYSQRISALKVQSEFVAGLADELAAFARETGIQMRDTATMPRLSASSY